MTRVQNGQNYTSWRANISGDNTIQHGWHLSTVQI